MYDNLAVDQELKLKKLMKEQNDLKENFESNVEQTQLFSNLLRLLSMKNGIVNNQFLNAKRNVEQYNSELNQRNIDGQERLVIDN